MSYIDLVGAIIRSGLNQEGPDYLLTDGGRYWCFTGNLDPAAVLRLAVNSHHPARDHVSQKTALKKRSDEGAGCRLKLSSVDPQSSAYPKVVLQS